MLKFDSVFDCNHDDIFIHFFFNCTLFVYNHLFAVMLYIDLRPGQAVKIGNAPVYITGASGRGISGYNLDC